VTKPLSCRCIQRRLFLLLDAPSREDFWLLITGGKKGKKGKKGKGKKGKGKKKK